MSTLFRTWDQSCVHSGKLIIILRLYVVTTGQGLPLTEEEQAQQNATTSLTVPGKVIHLSAILNKSKFRNKGDKEGAVAGLQLLEKAGLGELESMNTKRGAALVSVSITAMVKCDCI